MAKSVIIPKYYTAIRHKPIEKILAEEGKISAQIMEKVAAKRRLSKTRPEEILIKLGISEEDIAMATAKQLSLTYLDLSHYPRPNKDVLNLIPKSTAKTYCLLPIKLENETLTIAMSNPRDVIARDELTLRLGLKLKVMVVFPTVLKACLESYYAEAGADQEEVLEQIEDKYSEQIDIDVSEVDEDSYTSAPIVRLANHIIETACRKGSSDLHIESGESETLLRSRIDGVLYEMMTVPKKAHRPLISRIKIMSNLDIAEHRLPQDGRMKYSLADRDVDIRVAIAPTVFGEDVVMRILDRQQGCAGIDNLGFSSRNAEAYRSIIHKPWGMVLHVGPTGSGKTTTLYSALSEINKPGIKICTIEDPVEYYLKGIRQTSVNPKAGLDFARGLRAFLRCDPDVIMLGEIRDYETAKIAVEAAITGHLVLSTLHTTEAATAIGRLVDMGVEHFLVSSSITGIVAQRLLRRVCVKCRQPYRAKKEELKKIGFDIKEKEIEIFRAKQEGCPDCNNTGYHGRIGAHEVMIIDDNIRHLIIERASVAQIRETAFSKDMGNLYQDTFEKILAGYTTIEETLRVTQQS